MEPIVYVGREILGDGDGEFRYGWLFQKGERKYRLTFELESRSWISEHQAMGFSGLRWWTDFMIKADLMRLLPREEMATAVATSMEIGMRDE